MRSLQLPAPVISVLRSLRAVRSFAARPIEEAALLDILEVLRWSGSASNRQDWTAVLVRRREILEQLALLEGYAAHLAGAAAGLVLVMAGERPEQDAFDEGRLAERIMLAAHAHGLGSCIGWFQGSGREQAKQILEVSPERLIRTVVSLGYPAEEARPSGRRKPLADFVREI